ncbi:MAG: F0F1 ATP synthase subunit B [Acidimicrobiales bacterium]|jgi:F-type H+-transporting ATPase subunit b
MAAYLAEAVGFVLFLAFIYRYVRPFLKRMMDRQADAIRTSLSSADAAAENGERILADARAALEAARSEAAEIIARSEEIAAQIISDGKLRGQEEHDRLVAGAAVVADFECQRAKEEVTREVGSIVMDATELVVAAEIDASLQRVFIGKTIDAAEAMA